ncbi:MAG: hypothetical protein JNM88_03315 [Chitinophagaceae bacterium]|nr:hypothetical protein [Chitinophagaceae bacterium]
MNAAKIRLSEEEMLLLKNAGWILTKNNALEKVKRMLGELLILLQEIIQEKGKVYFPAEVLASAGKISRGENYLGLPWVILDHPRYFEKGNTMAFRTLFWWGRCFSITLHLSGRYKSRFEKSILCQYDTIRATASTENKPLYICVNGNEWEHHFEETNYRPIQRLDKTEWEKLILEKPFIKLAKMIPLDEWNGQTDINEILAWQYRSLLDLLKQED